MKRISILYLLLFTVLHASCDSELALKRFVWGMNKMMGEGFFPSSEILALGEFESSEVNVKKETVNGESSGLIEIRLYNGKSEAFVRNQESVARECAALYVEGFSKVSDYQNIIIYFVQTDPMNMENVAINEYQFEIKDFLDPNL
ncbi:hypothetical protein MM213_08505 [Belliella sp. R4-6]|uniref:Uncharacterized protein n=1 Tax=Belliella alkalica TaxID=1730871 RepID=A0ABS9VAQ6_9BACT|nr:hypothetical protein [Belliella alkalica]MCH7413522.1 hypothetical protein [Belliella alkalica]